MLKVIKRNGMTVDFNKDKIMSAIIKAFAEVDGETTVYATTKSRDIANYIEKAETTLTVEEIQDLVEEKLMFSNRKDVARAFVRYRYKREIVREIDKRNETIKELLEDKNEYLKKENSNKNSVFLSTQRDYMAGEVSKDIMRTSLPRDILDAHDKGIIHFHDMDYTSQRMHNCGLINLEDVLQNGTVLNGIKIYKPKSFLVACNIATQVILGVVSNQYGGATITLTHLAPFVKISYEKYLNKYLLRNHPMDLAVQYAKQDIAKEIKDGVQLINHQINSMSSTNGQSPFLTVFMYLNETEEYKEELALIIEEMLKQRIAGLPNEQGVNITVAFPKLIYVLDEDNIEEDGEYYYLTKLAIECSSKRLVPDYISAKKMKELRDGNVYPCMGCRSFLSLWDDENGKPKFYGRINQGVVTINLIDVALSSKGDLDLFWSIFEDRLDLCHRSLQIRHNTLKGTKSDVAPILWQHGAYARLEKGETIDKLLYGGYSTISLGFAGLYECVKYMTGESHTQQHGRLLGLEIMKLMNDHCDKWKEEENIGYSVYSTPIESTTYKFAKCLQKRFGFIEGITDKKYITNSYHITPSEEINAFDKLTKESEFQELSLGGNISYIETPNMTKNLEALETVVKHIYNTNIYAEINTTTSYCHECGCTDLKMEDDLKYHCPQCGNDDFDKMNIAVRVCGYISTNPFNDGRANDIHDRVMHVDDKEMEM